MVTDRTSSSRKTTDAPAADRPGVRTSRVAGAAAPAVSRGLSQRRTRARIEWSEEYQRRRAELLQAAATVFHQKGLAEATLADIADAAGTDRATVYYYVKNKHELFVEVIRDSLVATEAAAAAVSAKDLEPLDKLRQLIVSSVVHYAKYYPYLYIYAVEDLTRLDVDEPWQEELAERSQNIFEMYRLAIVEGLADGSIVSTLTPGVIAQILVGVGAWSHRWLRPEQGTDPVASGEALADLMLQGMAAPDPRSLAHLSTVVNTG